MHQTKKQNKMRGLVNIGSWVGIVAAISALAITWCLFTKDMERQKTALAQVSAKAASAIDHEMTMRAYSVMAMQKSAESMLNGRTEISSNITKFIRQVESKNGYTLAGVPGYLPNEIGRITGVGSVPAVGSAVSHEIAMSIALSPMFQTVMERDAETPWIYYISANKFIYLYPQVSINDYFYEDVSTRNYYNMALPERNPKHTVYWTPVYKDDGGKGLMVTVGAPVYHGATFRGALCIDIALAKLNWLLKGYEQPKLQMFIQDSNGELLAKHPENAQNIAITKLAPNSFAQQGNTIAYASPLKSVPWRLVATTSHQQMVHSALMHVLPVTFIALLLGVGVFLLMALGQSLLRVQELSVRDGLTGIYNRRNFDVLAKENLSRARRSNNYFGLILLDIDYFKLYNDTFGHQAGDNALIQVANTLKGVLKRPSDILFRVGGEEFAVIIEANAPEQIVNLANSLNEAIKQQAIEFSASPIGIISVSSGICILPPSSDKTTEDAYRQADQALYRAKEGGRNRIEVGA
jgi:diguanylate cyclase (GGDEF)-like protein